jgi:hypothetical protein
MVLTGGSVLLGCLAMVLAVVGFEHWWLALLCATAVLLAADYPRRRLAA